MQILRKKRLKNKKVLLLVNTGISNKYAGHKNGSFSRLSIIITDKDVEFKRTNQKEVFIILQKQFLNSNSKNETFKESERYKKCQEYIVNKYMDETFDEVWEKINNEGLTVEEIKESLND